VITLALCGRISIGEDVVTASLTDALRYSPALLAQTLLRKARPFSRRSLPAFDRLAIEPWPSLGGREPDSRWLLYRGADLVSRLVVEAKLGAPKTGEGEVDEEQRSGDQLAYYMSVEQREHPGERVSALYLTHHAALPVADLRESAEYLQKAGAGQLADELFWLSWRDVQGLLETMKESQPCLDVAELLRRVHMFRFQSVDLEPRLARAGTATFYNGGAPPERLSITPSETLEPFKSMPWMYRRRLFSPNPPLELTSTGAFYGGSR
jgi:hypothetical protein